VREPKPFKSFKEHHAKVFEAYEAMGKECWAAGPLDRKTSRLIKLGVTAGAGLDGGVKAHVRQGLDDGLTMEEIRHALILCLPTIGFPSMIAAIAWAEEEYQKFQEK
jgi:alkylhydroperoxidase/carboxymuconolactone decarboxylase family protein YurZ